MQAHHDDRGLERRSRRDRPGATDVAAGKERVLVCLDSHHTHDHVLAELEAYAPLVSVGSYCVVFDTVIEDLPEETYPDRPWGPGDNPKTAVQEFLQPIPSSALDKIVDNKLLMICRAEWYLKRLA